MNPQTKARRCLCCGGRTHDRYRVGVALDLLNDKDLRDSAGDWLLANLSGYCSIRCLKQAVVAPLVARFLLGGAA